MVSGLLAWVVQADSAHRVGEGVCCSALAAQADARAGHELQLQLTRAVLEGEAPRFDDDGALAHYTLERLRPRTWYLYR